MKEKILEFWGNILIYLMLLSAKGLGCDVEVKQDKDNKDLVDWIKFVFPKENND